MGVTSSPPQSPNPTVTAAAQTGENVQTAIANDVMSRLNQTDPYGDQLSYSLSGQYFLPDPNLGGKGPGYYVPTGSAPPAGAAAPMASGVDPNYALEQAYLNTKAGESSGAGAAALGTGAGGYWLPIYSQTTTLSPQNQAIYNTVQQTEGTLANTANSLAAAAQSRLATPLNLNQYQAGAAPTFGAPPSVSQFNPANYDGAYSAWEQPFNQAWNLQNQQLVQQLADQGINTGDTAYNNAMFGFTQNKQNALDTYNNSMLGNEIGAYNAYNTAALNAYNANVAAQLNSYEAGLQGKQYNANLALQNYNQPLNELSTLLHGNANGGGLTSIATPNFITIPSAQIPTTNVASIDQQAQQNANTQYQLQQQQNSALYGGLFGLGSSLLSGGALGGLLG